MKVDIEVHHGVVRQYERGRYAIHRGCPIKWELAPMCEVISHDPPKLKLTIMPRIPQDEGQREAL